MNSSQWAVDIRTERRQAFDPYPVTDWFADEDDFDDKGQEEEAMFRPIKTGSMSIHVEQPDDRLRERRPDVVAVLAIVDKYGCSYSTAVTAEQRDELVRQLTTA